MSYQIFQLTDQDRDILTQKNIVHRMAVSDKDPFMNKPKQPWRATHAPTATTNELMGSLEPYETRVPTQNNEFIRYTDQDRRYYHETEEMKRNASFNNNQKRQHMTM